MREIRAIVADDEPLARRGIRQLAAAHADLIVVGECRNGWETLAALDALQPDLLFLDVQMPGLDGFGVIRERGAERMPAVIFVTAYDEFAVGAFETQALDYLVKPVGEARFTEAVVRMRERLRAHDAVAFTRRLAALLGTQGGDGQLTVDALGAEAPARFARRLLVPTAVGELMLDVDDVDWIAADDYYAAVHSGGRRHLLRESLASLAARLDPRSFLRVHRSAIVQLARVRELRTTRSGESVLVLRDGTRVPVSRRRRERVRALLERLNR